MSTGRRIQELKAGIPENVKIIAVSKTHPPGIILEAYRSGQKSFGENKAQELIQKHTSLPRDIEWHMIGHLQTNKVKVLVPFVSLIQSVDSYKLLRTINKEAAMNNRIIDCMIQLKIAREETKNGLSYDDLVEILETDEYRSLKHIRVTGLMGMATFTNDEAIIRSEFHYLRSCFDKLKKQYFSGVEYFKEISMGMSDDYLIAIEEGATMIRVGSLIFGKRESIQ